MPPKEAKTQHDLYNLSRHYLNQLRILPKLNYTSTVVLPDGGSVTLHCFTLNWEACLAVDHDFITCSTDHRELVADPRELKFQYNCGNVVARDGKRYRCALNRMAFGGHPEFTNDDTGYTVSHLCNW